MHEKNCIQFLQEILPSLSMRWPGFRRVRRQVCRKIARRIADLGLAGFAAYQGYLLSHPEEWEVLDRLCRIAISRFYRDQAVFACLGEEVLPTLLRQATEGGEATIRGLSAGCASGEEPYTLSLLWELFIEEHTGCEFEIVASDSDPALLVRAELACYKQSSLRELPISFRDAGFTRQGGLYCLKAELRKRVQFLCQDIRKEMPEGPFHLICCRNLVFTYFSEALQEKILTRLHSLLLPGGALVIGKKESLPTTPLFSPWFAAEKIFRKS